MPYTAVREASDQAAAQRPVELALPPREVPGVGLRLAPLGALVRRLLLAPALELGEQPLDRAGRVLELGGGRLVGLALGLDRGHGRGAELAEGGEPVVLAGGAPGVALGLGQVDLEPLLVGLDRLLPRLHVLEQDAVLLGDHHQEVPAGEELRERARREQELQLARGAELVEVAQPPGEPLLLLLERQHAAISDRNDVA